MMCRFIELEMSRTGNRDKAMQTVDAAIQAVKTASGGEQ